MKRIIDVRGYYMCYGNPVDGKIISGAKQTPVTLQSKPDWFHKNTARVLRFSDDTYAIMASDCDTAKARNTPSEINERPNARSDPKRYWFLSCGSQDEGKPWASVKLQDSLDESCFVQFDNEGRSDEDVFLIKFLKTQLVLTATNQKEPELLAIERKGDGTFPPIESKILTPKPLYTEWKQTTDVTFRYPRKIDAGGYKPTPVNPQSYQYWLPKPTNGKSPAYTQPNSLLPAEIGAIIVPRNRWYVADVDPFYHEIKLPAPIV